MTTNLLTVLIVGIVLFEIIEHILFPLVWSFVIRNRRSLCGIEGMQGKDVEVKSWQGGEGRVFVDGELWKAESDDHLKPGDRAVVQKVDGLVLKVASLHSFAGGNRQ